MYFITFVLLLMSSVQQLNALETLDAQNCWKSATKRDSFNIIRDTRFLYYTSKEEKPAGNIEQICQNLSLSIAYITTPQEYTKIGTFFGDLITTKFSVYVGLGKMVNYSEDVQHDGLKKFQAFDLRQSSYSVPNGSCLALRIPLLQFPSYEAVACDTPVIPLCQFAKGTKCYESLPADQKEADDAISSNLVFVGKSRSAEYWGSEIQATWENANRQCALFNSYLYDGGLHKLSVYGNQKEINFDADWPDRSAVHYYQNYLGTTLDRWKGASWTSAYAHVIGSPESKFFIIVFKDGPSLPIQFKPDFGPDKLITDKTCVVVTQHYQSTLEYWDYVFDAAPCRMVNYFVCYRPLPYYYDSVETQDTRGEWFY